MIRGLALWLGLIAIALLLSAAVLQITPAVCIGGAYVELGQPVTSVPVVCE